MELLQLVYFCDAAQTEKFSQTAKKFFVPISNISQSVKRLEKELGVELFDHKKNSISLSNAGRQFYNYASKALLLLENAKAAVSDTKENYVGDIRLICDSNYKKVTVAIEKFLELHPNVNFTITQLPESDTEYDILISDIFPREHSKKILLFDEEILVAMNKNSHLTQKKNLTVSDLENERFIALSTSESIKNITVNVCREAGFSPVFSIQTHSTSFMRRYISMGLGVAFTPSSWNTDQSSDIVYRKIDNLRRKTYAFLPRQTYVKRSTLDFLKMLIEETGNTGFDIEAK